MAKEELLEMRGRVIAKWRAQTDGTFCVAIE